MPKFSWQHPLLHWDLGRFVALWKSSAADSMRDRLRVMGKTGGGGPQKAGALRLIGSTGNGGVGQICPRQRRSGVGSRYRCQRLESGRWKSQEAIRRGGCEAASSHRPRRGKDGECKSA